MPNRNWSKSDIVELQNAVEAGDVGAQREWAGRLLLGRGVKQDVAAALEWTEKAARGGDPQAAVWMGRKFLGDGDRLRAAAWFVVATESAQPGSVQDASKEIEALALDGAELSEARLLADEWNASIIRTPTEGSK